MAIIRNKGGVWKSKEDGQSWNEADAAAEQDGSVLGTNDADEMYGTKESDSLKSLAGDDLIKTGKGDDYAEGGQGDDRIIDNGNYRGENLIVNGDFESGHGLGNQSWGTFSEVGAWYATGTDADNGDANGTGHIEIQQGQFGGTPDNDADNSVMELDSHNGATTNSTVSQDFSVVDGGLYKLNFMYGMRNNAETSEFCVEVKDSNGDLVQLVIFSSDPDSLGNDHGGKVVDISDLSPGDGYQKFNIGVNLDAGDYTLSFVALGSDDSIGALIDNVSVTQHLGSNDVLWGDDAMGGAASSYAVDFKPEAGEVGSASSNGITVSAVEEDGSEGVLTFSNSAAGMVGMGVKGANGSGIANQVGNDPVSGECEKLVVDFDGVACNATFGISNLYANEGGSGNHEQLTWVAYKDGEMVGTGTVTADDFAGSNNNGTFTISGFEFDSVELMPTDFSGDDYRAGDSSDFYLTSVSYDALSGSDYIRGHAGEDIIFGQGNDDELFGDRDNDLIHGGSGNDDIRGGHGDDTLYGDGIDSKMASNHSVDLGSAMVWQTITDADLAGHMFGDSNGWSSPYLSEGGAGHSDPMANGYGAYEGGSASAWKNHELEKMDDHAEVAKIDLGMSAFSVDVDVARFYSDDGSTDYAETLQWFALDEAGNVVAQGMYSAAEHNEGAGTGAYNGNGADSNGGVATFTIASDAAFTTIMVAPYDLSDGESFYKHGDSSDLLISGVTVTMMGHEACDDGNDFVSGGSGDDTIYGGDNDDREMLVVQEGTDPQGLYAITGDSATIDLGTLIDKAGYDNSLGYYIVDKNGNIKGGQIISASSDADQGSDVMDEIEIVGMKGMYIGFFLVADGADANAGNNKFVDGAVVRMKNGELTVGKTAIAGNIFYTEIDRNEDGIDHEMNGGWEDLMNGGDNDYNDLMVDVVVKDNVYQEVLNGDSGNDTIYGEDGDDRINGGNDDDMLDGGAGNDYILGGSGNDVIDGGLGSDRIAAGNGDDTVTADSADWGRDYVARSGHDAAAVDGGKGYDTLVVNEDVDLSGVAIKGFEAVDANGHDVSLNLWEAWRESRKEDGDGNDNQATITIFDADDLSIDTSGNWNLVEGMSDSDTFTFQRGNKDQYVVIELEDGDDEDEDASTGDVMDMGGDSFL